MSAVFNKVCSVEEKYFKSYFTTITLRQELLKMPTSTVFEVSANKYAR
jgi:hypothetical protein